MSESTKQFTATVEQADDEIVVLDVEGHRVKLPRAMLPGTVREGAGFVLTVAPAPQAESALKQSIQDRLRALQSMHPPLVSAPSEDPTKPR